MARWLGIVVSSDKLVVVDAEVPAKGPLTILADHSWKLQNGDRAAAYAVMHQQVADYIKERSIKKVVVKASAVSLGGTKKPHLEACELRGVVLCAAAPNSTTQAVAKNSISRNFGNRKVDEYLKDDKFWAGEIAGDLRVGSREAAMILIAARKTK